MIKIVEMPNQRAYLNQNYNEKIETVTKKN